MTAVDRATRCILSYAVVWERTWNALQETSAPFPALPATSLI